MSCCKSSATAVAPSKPSINMDGSHKAEDVVPSSRTAKCYCGAVSVTVEGPPNANAFCHCSDCRHFTGAVGVAAQIYDVDKVTLTGDVIGRGINAASNRKACAKCGGCVLNDHQHSMKCLGVYAGLFEDKWEPEFHLFYPERIMDVKDGKPKFKDMPGMWGGSDEKVEE